MSIQEGRTIRHTYDLRVVRRYLWLPRRVDGRWRWLRWVRLTQAMQRSLGWLPGRQWKTVHVRLEKSRQN